MEFTKRKKIVLIGMLALIVCVGVLNNRLNNDQNLSASAGYTDYEMDQMSLHDGDVLVDSVNVTGIPGTSGAAVDPNAAANQGAAASPSAVIDTIADGSQVGDIAQGATGEAIDSSMIVTSDNYAELANADTYFEEVRATINMDRNQVISMLTDVIEETKEGPEKKKRH